jgi:hypothetical protein
MGAQLAETRDGCFVGCVVRARERSDRGFFEGCEVRRGEREPSCPDSSGKPIEPERKLPENAANLVRRRLQHTGVCSAEKTVEVARNHEDGTRITGWHLWFRRGQPREWTRGR